MTKNIYSDIPSIIDFFMVGNSYRMAKESFEEYICRIVCIGEYNNKE